MNTDNIRFFSRIIARIIVELNATVHIGPRRTGTLQKDSTSAPGVVHQQPQTQVVCDLHPPGVVQGNLGDSGIGIILDVIANGGIGRVGSHTVGGAGEGGDAGTEDGDGFALNALIFLQECKRVGCALLGIERTNAGMADSGIDFLLYIIAVCLELFNIGQGAISGIPFRQHPECRRKRIFFGIHVDIWIIADQLICLVGRACGILKAESVCNKGFIQSLPFILERHARACHNRAVDQLGHLAHQANSRKRTKRTCVDREFSFHIQIFNYICVCLEIAVHQLRAAKVGCLGGTVCSIVHH